MGSLTSLDLTVLVVFLTFTAAVGLWMGRGKKGGRDYFIANHSISWWAILLSVVATETSALTFISVPGIAYKSDFTFLQIGLGYVAGRTVVAYLFLPRFFNGDLVTAYEFLGKRFGPETRRFASLLFLFTRTLADAVRLFATAIPVATIAGSSLEPQTAEALAIAGISLLTLIYAYYGGMRAVIWTDVIQTVVYLVGATTALYLLHVSFPGGWAAIIQDGRVAGKFHFFDFSLRLDKPFTFFAGVIGGGFLSMASHGTDQIIVQRLLASKNLKNAQKALIGSGFVVLAQFFIFLVIGAGLYSYFHHVDFPVPDGIFPKFIAESMPSGIKGLVLAGILAATMSAHSGALNSLAAASVHDIYVPLFRPDLSDSQRLPLARFFTFMWALVLMGTAFSFSGSTQSLVNVALSVASFTYGGLLGGFFLGFFGEKVQQKDALIGIATGVAVMTVLVFSKTLSSLISWPWYVLAGTVVTVVTGLFSSFFFKKES